MFGCRYPFKSTAASCKTACKRAKGRNLINATMSEHSDTEPAYCKALREKLSVLSLESHAIQELSAEIREITDPVMQETVARVWLSEVLRTLSPTRLLALCYLANDVIQQLRGSEQNYIYRYIFAAPFAQAVVHVRLKANVIVPKVERVVAIFQARSIYDTRTLMLLQQAAQDETNLVMANVLPKIANETTVNQAIHIAQLEKELLELQQRHLLYSSNLGDGSPSAGATVAAAAQQQEATNASCDRDQTFADYAASPVPHSISTSTHCSSASNVLHSSAKASHVISSQHQDLKLVSYIDPNVSSDVYVNITERLKRMYASQPAADATSLDAQSVSRIRGYRVPLNASMSTEDQQLLTEYRVLLNENLQCQRDIQEKADRRRKEENATQFSLLSSSSTQATEITAAGRVDLLLKKEWHLRCQKQKLEHTLYWQLVHMLDYLSQRLNRLQAITQGIETETQRRSEGKL